MPDPLTPPTPENAELLSRLAELRDLELPAAVSAWPPAPGWWGVAVLALAALFLVHRWLRARRRRRLYRQEALAALHEARSDWETSGDAVAYASATARLIRRIAIHHLGREAVARRTGGSFVEIANTLSTQALSRATATTLAESRYRPDPELDVERLHGELEAWLSALVEPRRA